MRPPGPTPPPGSAADAPPPRVTPPGVTPESPGAAAMAAFTAGLPPYADHLTWKLGSVDRLLAKIANFLLGSPPGTAPGSRPILAGGRQVGIEVRQPLHPLEVELEPPSPARGVRAADRLGAEAMAELRAELRFTPGDFVAAPGLPPPPTVFDPRRSQRFVMLDARLRFGGGEGRRLELFGTGRTFPAGGGRCRLGAALDVVRGHGPFAELPGIAALNGILEPPAGLRAALLVRLADPGGGLAGAPPPARALPARDPGTTLLLVKGENNFHHSTSLIQGLDGSLLGADLRQVLRRVRIGSASPPAAVVSATDVGTVAALLEGTIWFDLLSPPPVPFLTERGIFDFVDGDRRTVGWLEANVVEGRGFLTPLPGAPTPILRGVGLAPVLRGTGAFENVAGLLTVATWISVFPRQVSSLFLFRVDDPDGRYRGGRS